MQYHVVSSREVLVTTWYHIVLLSPTCYHLLLLSITCYYLLLLGSKRYQEGGYLVSLSITRQGLGIKQNNVCTRSSIRYNALHEKVSDKKDKKREKSWNYIYGSESNLYKHQHSLRKRLTKQTYRLPIQLTTKEDCVDRSSKVSRQ